MRTAKQAHTSPVAPAPTVAHELAQIEKHRQISKTLREEYLAAERMKAAAFQEDATRLGAEAAQLLRSQGVPARDKIGKYRGWVGRYVEGISLREDGVVLVWGKPLVATDKEWLECSDPANYLSETLARLVDNEVLWHKSGKKYPQVRVRLPLPGRPLVSPWSIVFGAIMSSAFFTLMSYVVGLL